MIHERRPQPIDVLEGAAVDARAGVQLLGAVADLGASALEPALSRSERLARAERATDAAGGLVELAATLDPYRDPERARLVDLLTASGHRAYASHDVPAARDRLAIARAADVLAVETRAGVNLAGLQIAGGRLAPLVEWAEAFPLLSVAAPLALGGPASGIPGPWENIPDAVTGWDTEPAGSTPELDEVAATVLVGRWSFNVAGQAFAWSPVMAREYETLAAHQVRKSLEIQLAGVLVAAADAAASLDAAESAVGAVWPAGASLVLASGTDLPAVRRAYASAFPDPADRPDIRGTYGLTAGSVLVIALPGVRVEASPVQWAVAESPKVLGREVTSYAYGRAAVRIPGAVQLVTLGATTTTTTAAG